MDNNNDIIIQIDQVDAGLTVDLLRNHFCNWRLSDIDRFYFLLVIFFLVIALGIVGKSLIVNLAIGQSKEFVDTKYNSIALLIEKFKQYKNSNLI